MICRTRIAAVAVAVSAVTALAGCSLPDGPPGVVVAKDNKTPPASKSRPYFLTVRTAEGERKPFQVLISDYDKCAVGDPYPACTEGQ
ncbi:hypothetical protein OG302_14810 [Streptomyces sp. NBC_01283]|uniref:hypothetical protein n=1 Tax=Streptomyces sp. NBC_01283 TaxID=2903812 RepID=UPI00352C466B|nr:hypothetical protein OG302_14810 [Streptomyces sp. NBC_01283]